MEKCKFCLESILQKIKSILKDIYNALFVDHPWYVVAGHTLLSPIYCIILFTWLLLFIIKLPFVLISFVFRFVTFKDLAPDNERFDYEITIEKVISKLQEYHYDDWALEVMKASSSCTSFSEIREGLLVTLPKLVLSNVDYEVGIEKEVANLLKFLNRQAYNYS